MADTDNPWAFLGKQWRVGRRVGRCIHMMVGTESSEDDILIGVFDTPELSRHIVGLHNHAWRVRHNACNSDTYARLPVWQKQQADAVVLILQSGMGAYSGSDTDILTDAARIVLAVPFAPPSGDNHHNAAACPYCTPQSPGLDTAGKVEAIFDRETAAAEANMEPSPMIDWLERLRDEVLAALRGSGGGT